MNRSTASSFMVELRVSPNPVSALLLVAALVLTLFAWNLPEPDKALNFALLLFIVVGITWVLNSWQPRIGRWSAILALVVIIHSRGNPAPPDAAKIHTL